MALLADDLLREFEDDIDYKYLLDYIFSGVSCYYNALETGGDECLFRVMRFVLSEKISDKIRYIGIY